MNRLLTAKGEVGARSPDRAPAATGGLPLQEEETFGRPRGTVRRPCPNAPPQAAGYTRSQSALTGQDANGSIRYETAPCSPRCDRAGRLRGAHSAATVGWEHGAF